MDEGKELINIKVRNFNVYANEYSEFYATGIMKNANRKTDDIIANKKKSKVFCYAVHWKDDKSKEYVINEVKRMAEFLK